MKHSLAYGMAPGDGREDQPGEVMAVKLDKGDRVAIDTSYVQGFRSRLCSHRA